ncbi:MAG: TetR/AcrR family transcriptional regulator C-terminal domain-containing protein [Oscillospiraceae bacterium]|nr:TetR/AcrR family transcriptional regulator C-terminal domain-containing protein [Oscillospiraceae bacterium]
MKHEITSMNTKKTLSASLKKLMEHKKLSKISVSEIITDCGVNRKTFYYHFQDIYALLKWTLEQETVEILKNYDLLQNPEEALVFVTDYVDDNIHILNCAFDSMGREGMKRFFYDDFYNVVLSIMEGLEKEQNIVLADSFKEYMVNFYTEALSGMLIDYFQHRDERNRNELIKNTLFILKTSIPHIIEVYGANRGVSGF